MDISTLALTALCLPNSIIHYSPLRSHPFRWIGLFLLLKPDVTIQILAKVSFWIQILNNSKPRKISASAKETTTWMILRWSHLMTFIRKSATSKAALKIKSRMTGSWATCRRKLNRRDWEVEVAVITFWMTKCLTRLPTKVTSNTATRILLRPGQKRLEFSDYPTQPSNHVACTSDTCSTVGCTQANLLEHQVYSSNRAIA